MDEYIPRLREQGINIPHKQDAVPHLLQEWKDLSKSEKFKYEYGHNPMSFKWNVLICSCGNF